MIRDSGIERFSKDSIPLHGTVPNGLVLKQVWNGVCIAWEQESLYSPKLPQTARAASPLVLWEMGTALGFPSVLPGLCLQTPYLPAPISTRANFS